jgi:hypothetical protein
MGTSRIKCSGCPKYSQQVGSINGFNYCLLCYSKNLKAKNRRFGEKKPEVVGKWKQHPEFGYAVRVV